MRFRDIVDELNKYHNQLWFRPGTKLSGFADQYPDEWGSSTIVSAGGRLLAFQIGDADEWELGFGYQPPDGKLDFHDEDQDEELITPNFVSNANFIIHWIVRDPGEDKSE
ncbi:hypothetical protein J1786_08000 [Rahnella sp. L72c]|uniref:Uncharacterized protein n=1 Tax=Rahnella perminowiae TaxID=2816244 RepID=A0ABS6KZK9_9GAMM|nr:hypothetical protein [Rahnella perminowiae]MBU9834754.1 hypothetical protein [Rahnella perminowiae]